MSSGRQHQRPGPPRDEASRRGGFPHYHTFVSHTGAQKDGVAFPIREKLIKQHPKMSVFVDEAALRVGDDAVAHMRAGLVDCDTAVVVLSSEYIRKRWPMWELHILLPRVLKGEAGLLVVLYGGTTCLEELASKDARCYSNEFWGSGDSEEAASHAPDAQQMALLQQWAQDPASLEGCSLVRPDQWTTMDELTDLVEAGVADLLHASGQLPPRLDVFRTIPDALWPDLEVRQAEARQAEAALLQHRYVELCGGPGEGKSTMAQHLTDQLCARWRRSPPDGAVGAMCHALEVDLRGVGGGASLKDTVASQVLAAASVVAPQAARHSSAAPLHGQRSTQQEPGRHQWHDFIIWAESQAPRPLLLLLENAEDGMRHEDLPEVVVQLRGMRHVHLVVATRAHTSLSQQVEAPAECAVDLGVLDMQQGLRVMELHLGRDLQAGDEQEAARKLVQVVQANPLFCGVAACLVKQTGRTWQELLVLCGKDMALVRPADGRAGGMGRRLTLLQRWLWSALEPQEQRFLAHVAVFAGSFTAAGAAAMQLPGGSASVPDKQDLLVVPNDAIADVLGSGTGADTAPVRLPGVGVAAAPKEESHQQQPSTLHARLLGGEPGRQVDGSSDDIEKMLQRLQLLSLLRVYATGNEPASYHMGSRWLMHALVQQAASKLLQEGGGPGQPTAAPSRNVGTTQAPAGAAAAQLDARFTQWMLWQAEGPGQVLAECEPVDGNQPDARLMWYLIAVEQANLSAAVEKLVLTDPQAECWQGDLGMKRVFAVDRVSSTFTNIGQYLLALRLRKYSVDALTANHGATNANTLRLQVNLADTHYKMGQLGAARQLQEDLLAARTRLLGRNHPDTLSVKNNLAVTVQDMGQLGEARQLQEEVLAAMMQQLGGEHPNILTVKSNLSVTVNALGQLGQARQLQEELLAAMVRQLGPDHRHTLDVQNNLANTLEAMGELAEARQVKEGVLAALTQLLGAEHPSTLTVKSNVANTLQEMGCLGEARQVYEEVLAALTELLGPKHPDVLNVKSNLANALQKMGQMGQAQQLKEEVLTARTQLLGPEHPDTLVSKSNLGSTLQAMGQLATAQQVQEEVLAARTRQLGLDHPDTLTAKSNLATTLAAMGQLTEARQLQEAVLESSARLLGPEHPTTLVVKNDLAHTLQLLGQLAEALQLHKGVLTARTQLLGCKHPDTLASKNGLAHILSEMGQLGEARQLQEEVLTARTQLLGLEHPDSLVSKTDLANTLGELGQLQEARQLKEEVLAAMLRLLGPNHPDTLRVKSNLATTLQVMGQLREATVLQEEVLAATTQLLGARHPNTLIIKSNLANLLQKMARLGEARQLQTELLGAMVQLAGPDHPNTLRMKSNLASTLQQMGELGEARQLKEEVLAAMTDRLGPEHPNTLGVKSNFASALHAMGQLEEARQLQEEVLAALMKLLGPDHPTTLIVKSNLASTLQALGGAGCNTEAERGSFSGQAAAAEAQAP